MAPMLGVLRVAVVLSGLSGANGERPLEVFDGMISISSLRVAEPPIEILLDPATLIPCESHQSV